MIIESQAITVRQLQTTESDMHRDVRLRALSDASDLLGARFGEAAALPMYYWQDLTHALTAAENQAMFVALKAEHVVGCVYVFVDEEREDLGRVRGMWVEPISRRRGIASA